MAINRKAMREAAERQRQRNRERGSGEQEAAQAKQPDELHNTLAPDLAQYAATDSQPIGDQIECPACAELVKARAKVCKHCGHDMSKPYKAEKPDRRKGKAKVRTRTIVVHSTKSGGLAAVLSFFWPGLGHVYAGQIMTGVALFVGFPVVIFFVSLLWSALFKIASEAHDDKAALFSLTFLVIIPVLWIGQMYLAYHAANRR